MLPGMIAGLLADGDWGRILGPLVLVAFYVISAIFKSVGNRSAKAEDKENEPEMTAATASEKPRYKPLNDAARPSQTPQVRTLPYARTAAQAGSPHIAQTTGELTDWDRQQRVKQQQLEQTEAFRRQQLLEQRRQQLRQQAALQERRQQQQRQPVRKPAAVGRPAPVAVRPAVAQKRAVVVPSKAVSQAVKVSPPAAQDLASDKPVKIRGLLLKPGSMRAAIMLKEILDKPLAMRNL